MKRLLYAWFGLCALTWVLILAHTSEGPALAIWGLILALGLMATYAFVEAAS